ncbi:hypothetical protein B194_0049 [Serratia plymuthica A30]|nr:hypothetical protein B194_0049 [Serratia plymuthica A30]
MRGSRADFHVQWLNNGAALARPIVLQCQDQALKGLGIKLLHVEFARDTSGFIWNGPVYPLTVRYTARIRQQVRIGEEASPFHAPSQGKCPCRMPVQRIRTAAIPRPATADETGTNLAAS